MFMLDIIKQKCTANNHQTPDPLDVPDDPTNPLQLERHDMSEKYGLSTFHLEEKHWMYRRWMRFCPDWLKWPMNPSNERVWSIVRDADDITDPRNHFTRYLKEMEVAIAEGHERIVIQPRDVAEYASEWIRVGEYCHYYALNYGIISMWITYRHPTAWWLYLPLSIISFCNAYSYSRYWRTDRFYRYRIFEPELYDQGDTEPIVTNVEPGELEEWPGTYWVLKRVGRVKSSMAYVYNQTSACLSTFFVAMRMANIEEWVCGPSYRVVNVGGPINTCNYFLPSFIDYDIVWADVLPSDIHRVRVTDNFSIAADEWMFLGMFLFYAWDLFDSLRPSSRPPEGDGKGKIDQPDSPPSVLSSG